jgi:hypothetical protein
MLLGAVAAARRRPGAVPLPFALGGFGAVYDPYHLESMVAAGGAAPEVGDPVVGIIPTHGSNEARTSGSPLPNRLVLDGTGLSAALPPLLALKDGRQCWDLRGSPGRALWGSAAGHDLRASLKGCFGAMLWLEPGLAGAPMTLNRHATASYPLGLLQPWEFFAGNRGNFPYGCVKNTTASVLELFSSTWGNDSSSFLPASGGGGGWHACIVQFQVGGSANTTTVRFNVWKDGVELQDATGAARKVWDDNAAADNMDRFTLGAQQHAGAVASGRFFQSWIGRSFWRPCCCRHARRRSPR